MSEVLRLPGMTIRGEFRLRICDAKLREEVARDCPDWTWEQQVVACAVEDTGWVPNVVTDQGRRRLYTPNQGWGNNFDVFIHESVAEGNVRRGSIQFIYADQPQVANVTGPNIDLDRLTLLQTRTATFPTVGVSRNINMVGLTSDSGVVSAQNALHGIVAYTKLSSTVVQGPAQTADAQYRVTWSLDP